MKTRKTVGIFIFSILVIIGIGFFLGRKREEKIITEEKAKALVERLWKNQKYDASKISITDIQEYEDGCLFLLDYTGDNPELVVFYAEFTGRNWSIQKAAEGKPLENEPLIINSFVEGEDTLVFGKTGTRYYDAAERVTKKVHFNTLTVVYDDETASKMELDESPAFLVVQEGHKEACEWRASDEEHEMLLDSEDYDRVGAKTIWINQDVKE